MENIKFIFKVMFKYPTIIIWGIISLLGYAVFGGVSITFAKPLLDLVFLNNNKKIIYTSFTQFMEALAVLWSKIFDTVTFSKLFDSVFYKNIQNNFYPEFKDLVQITEPKILLMFLVILILFMTIIKNICFITNKICFAKLRGLTVRDLRLLLFGKYLNQTLSFHKKNAIGDSQVRMTNDINIVSRFFIQSFLNSTRDVSLILTYLFFAMFINLKLFLLMMVVVPFFSVAISFIGKKIKKYAKRTQNATASIYSRIEEILNYIMVVKSFSQESREKKKYQEINDKLYKSDLKASIYDSFSHPLSEFNGSVIGVVIILVGGSMVLDPNVDFTFGDFTIFLAFVFSSLHPIKTATKGYNNIKKAMVSITRIKEVVDVKVNIVEDENPIIKSDFTNEIVFEDVSFKYNTNEKDVLKKINIKFNKGERIALVGSSGSGKTTLTLLLNRLYDVTGGKILIDGVDLRKLEISKLRNFFGVVTQDSMLFAGSIRDNISYGLKENLNDLELEKLLKQAHAYEFVEKMEDKFDAKVFSKGGNLSGGQKQRLCIARAIAICPHILIFDEATSALDTESERQVQLAMEDTSKNRTVIMIAHRLSTILNADKIVVMDNGEILDIGTHKELLLSSPKYQKLYNLQFSSK